MKSNSALVSNDDYHQIVPSFALSYCFTMSFAEAVGLSPVLRALADVAGDAAEKRCSRRPFSL
jgi:hypothetical protein